MKEVSDVEFAEISVNGFYVPATCPTVYID